MQKVSNTAERLKEYMATRNLTQADIVRMCNGKISKSTLSFYVSGKRTPVQKPLGILSESLHVSIPWLMGYDVEPQNYEEIVIERIDRLNNKGRERLLMYLDELEKLYKKGDNNAKEKQTNQSRI